MNEFVPTKSQAVDYKLLFENSLSATVISNPSGEILDCNKSFLKYSGYNSVNEVIGTNLSNYFKEKDGKTLLLLNSEKEPFTKKILRLVSVRETFTEMVVFIQPVMFDDKKLFIVNALNKNLISEPGITTTQRSNPDSINLLIKKLKQSEDKFRKISELSSSPVCIQTLEKFLYVNRAWEVLTGYSREESTKLHCHDIIHPDFSKLIKNRFKAKLEGRKVPAKFDIELITKAGKEIWVNANLSVIEYEGERAIMMVLVDITEMKRTQQALKSSKKKFQSLFYENTSTMYVVDPQNGNIVDANEAACKFYGYSKAKIITLNLSDINITSKEEIEAEILSAMNEKRNHFFFKHKLSNGEIRDVEIYSGKVNMKDSVFLYSIVHDITARKEAEEALKKSEKELKQLNAQKDRFFSIIAHDLRGPLGTFMQLTEYLKENYSTLDDKDFENYFKHLYESAAGTFKLLENLLVWTRSQLGAIVFSPEKINLLHLCNETVSILAESAHAKKIQIDIKINKKLEVIADKNTIATVLRNLLNNAIKFTKTGGQVTISAKRSRKLNINGQTFVEIHINDTGVGIEKKDIERLFKIEEGYSSPGTNNEKGTGLGLILCQELVNRNGGQIWVQSTPDIGSTFSFSLAESLN